MCKIKLTPATVKYDRNLVTCDQQHPPTSERTIILSIRKMNLQPVIVVKEAVNQSVRKSCSLKLIKGKKRKWLFALRVRINKRLFVHT